MRVVIGSRIIQLLDDQPHERLYRGAVSWAVFARPFDA